MVTQDIVKGSRNYSRPSKLSELKKLSKNANYFALYLVVFAVLYNAVLASIGARGFPVGYLTVAGVEIIIISACFLLCFSCGISITDLKPIGLVWFIGFLAVIASIKYDMFYVGSIRNFLLIACFSMLGQRMDERFVKYAFFIISSITLLVLTLEIISVETYAMIFSPASYFEMTRGSAKSEFDNSGLSIGTIAFEGRFSLGVFSGRRTSSIFLEQVGINAYAIVCMVFLNGFWNKLSAKERVLQVITIVLIVLSNNARMAALMCLVMPIGYFVFTKINRIFIIFIPIFIISFIFIISSKLQNAVGDDLIGRLAVTYRLLNSLDVSDLIFGNPYIINRTADSGYAFVITSVGLFGAIAYLIFLVIYPRFETLEQRRGSWSAALYILLWLTVGGTGSFSIKTASLLWVFIGCLSRVEKTIPKPLDVTTPHTSNYAARM